MKISITSSLIISFLLILCCTSLKAQGWERLFHGKQDYLAGIHKTPDNGYLLISTKGLLKLDANGREEAYYPSDSSSINSYDNALFTDDNHIIIAGIHQNNPNDPFDRVRGYLKMDWQGNIIWEKVVADNLSSMPTGIDAFPNRDLVIAGYKEISSNTHFGSLIKTDSSGNILWDVPFGGDSISFVSPYNGDLIALNDGSSVVTYSSVTRDSINNTWTKLLCWLQKFDTNGQLLWTQTFGDSTTMELIPVKIMQTRDDGFAILGVMANTIDPNFNSIFLIKTNSNGDEEWTRYYHTLPNIGQIAPALVYDFVQTSDGGYSLVGSTSNSLPNNAFMLRLDPQGNEIWHRYYRAGNSNVSTWHSVINDNHGFVVAGRLRSGSVSRNSYLMVAKTDSLGYSITNRIEGYVYHDDDANCTRDTAETRLSYWPLFVIGENALYARSKLDGSYHMDADTGDYTVLLVEPNPYWEACQPIQNIRFDTPFDTITLDLGAEILIDCPLLSVGVSSTRMVRCFQNKMVIHYSNTGTMDAQNAYIELELDDFLIVDSTSIPIASQNGQQYRFDLGTVPYNHQGQFEIYFTISCDAELGQTHCVEAHIFPDSICLSNPNWSGASVEVGGRCDGDTLNFVIRNIGAGNMADLQPYYIVVDDVILRNEQFQLPAGDSLEIPQMPAGATVRLMATQEPGHPGNSQPTIAFEGCGGPPNSQGYINQFPEDDSDTFRDVFCAANTGSYDPNEKHALPLGFGPEHYIAVNQDLEYTIHFQNTGTDTAYRVVIIDTLPPQLDPLTIRPKAASHQYEYEVYSTGIIKFTFDNIFLPDSSANLLESQGFVQFRISQQADLAIGSIIENSAAIYFDFNSPIITNTVWHTIGENFVPMNIVNTHDLAAQAIRVQVSPNPFQQTTRFDFTGYHWKEPLQLSIYNLNGQLIQEFPIREQTFWLEAEGWPAGIYFYELTNDRQVLSIGKLILQ